MSKPVLLSGGNGKVSELAGNQNRQVLTWSKAGDEWAPGPSVSGSGGGGQTFFFNFGNQANVTPNSVLPQSTGSVPTTSPSLLGPTYNASSTAVTHADVPYSASTDTFIAGFVTATNDPGVTQIFSGLWDFNIWMAATGAVNGPTQMSVTARVYIMNGAGTAYGNASGGAGGGVALATSDQVYLYDQKTLAQYILNVTMPQTVILATDRIYIELYARRNESSGQIRGIDIRFETARPSHVHTTIQVPVNLGTDVSGILPVANGGTNAGTAAINTVFAGPSSGSTGAPLFRPLVTADIPSLSANYLPLAGGTLTGKLTTPAPTTLTAGFTLPHGTAPTFLVPGDIWTTTTAIQARLGTTTFTIALLAATQSWSGVNTFSSGNNSFGTSTATGTTNLATGTTVLGATKTVNIGTNGAAGSATIITIGALSAGTSTTTVNGTLQLTEALTAPSGGTGQASYAVGDLLYANGTYSLARLADVATGSALISGGVSTTPSWGKIGLTTHVSGTLPVANGGTGASTLTGYVKASGTSAFTASAAIPVADVTGAAPLASPTFTGTPSLPTGTTGVTQTAGDSSTKLATTAFVTTAVAASSGIPYDLPAEIPGTPATATKVVNFKAVRSFVLATTGHQGGQLTAPSGNFICTVRKNATTLGTITFGASSFSSSITGTLVDRTFAATDVLSVETPSAVLGIDTPYFTLLMTLA